MRKVAYIFSFGHSGSTLLSLILEQHQKTVSIGEFNSFSAKLDGLHERYCTCGELVPDCTLWKSVYQSCKNKLPNNLKEQYGLLLDSFANNFPDDAVMVDSSKVIKNLMQLQTLDDVDLRVIYLVKDFRSFLISTKRKALKRGESFGLLKSLKYALIWHRDNQYNLNYLEQQGISHLKIGYEELCLYSQEANKTLFEFLGLESLEDSINIQGSQGHMIFGNRMRRDPKKNMVVKYDSSWFTDNIINLVGLLLPRIAKFNQKVTYSNKFDQMWR